MQGRIGFLARVPARTPQAEPAPYSAIKWFRCAHLYIYVSAPFSFRRPQTKTRSTSCCVHITIGSPPHWIAFVDTDADRVSRSRCHSFNPGNPLRALLPAQGIITSTQASTQAKGAQHVSLYHCCRSCHRWPNSPIVGPAMVPHPT